MDTSENNTNAKIQALETLKLFRIIFKSANRHFHEVEKLAGIGGASLWALAEIMEADELKVSELAANMSIHQSTASNLLDKLESEGYITKVKSTLDRRVVYLKITDLGRQALAKAPLPHRGIYCPFRPFGISNLMHIKKTRYTTDVIYRNNGPKEFQWEMEH